MTAHAELPELVARALGRRELELRAANQTTEGLGHLDIDQARRVDVSDQPAAFGLGPFAEEVSDRTGCVNNPLHLRRPLSRAARMSRVLTLAEPRARIRSSSSSGVGVRATLVISRRT